MIDFIALAAAIVLVVAATMLRGFLAFPFPRQRVRKLAARPPAGAETLFEEATATLATLGFEPGGFLAYQRVDGEPATAPLRALFLHAQSGGAVVLAAPVAPKHPHQLLTVFCHKLADGRLAVSQAYDCYFEQTQTNEMLAQTIGVPGLPLQWQAHLEWVGKQGDTAPIRDEADVLDAFGDAYERQRQALIARGDLYEANENLALPKLRFAFRLLLAYLKMSAPPNDPRPVPPERLALLANQTETVRHRSPPRAMQWSLFGVSVVLFMLVGAVLWDARFAFVLLVVILFHELGHFLAMRTFGYRNTHILALPLVGGVAMGVDAKPGATKAAWMSLMGPLPGIVVGWVLLAAYFLLPATFGNNTVLAFAIAFLAVNYLNVLPVPPLDGGHVVQALLPQRWSRLRTVFVGVACAIGALASWAVGFIIIAVLAVLQLLGLPAQWRLHKVEDELLRDAQPLPSHQGMRLLRVFRAMEKVLGPTPQAAQRVEQGLQLSRMLATEPMTTPARIGTGAVYAGLLVVPMLALLFGWSTLLLGSGLLDALVPAEERARYEAMRQDYEALNAEVASLPLSQLLDGIDGGTGRGASPQALVEAIARLGSPLPGELREIYELRDGIPDIGLAKLADIESADAVLARARASGADKITVYVDDEEAQPEEREIALDDLRGWWRIGNIASTTLIFDPAPEPRLPPSRLIWLEPDSGVASSQGGLRVRLEQEWVQRQAMRRMRERREAGELSGFED